MTTTSQPIGVPSGIMPIVNAVQQAAQQSGIDFDYLLDVARVESGFDPAAQAATSSARGLFQFTNQTWLATVFRHGHGQGYGWAADAIQRQPSGRFAIADPAMRSAVLQLRDDPVASARMAAMLTGNNRDQLAAQTGRSPEPVDLYLAHFLGASGAASFLGAWENDPDQAAAPLLPAAAAANRSVFYSREGVPRSLNDIRERFRAKLDDSRGPLLAGKPRLNSAPSVVQTQISRGQQQAGSRSSLEMLEIRPMPKQLSLAFAADAYRRLAAVDGRGMNS